jgi:hypothetical protein
MAEKQNHEVRIKLTKSEHSKIKSKASQSYMTMTAFMKYLGLNSTIRVVSGE